MKQWYFNNLLPVGPWLFAAAICLAVPATALPQTCPLGLEAAAVPVEQLTISDFDVDNFQARGVLFTVNISNPADSPAVDVQMNVILNIQLATGEGYAQATIMRTDPFSIPPGGRTVTNLDLGKSSGIGFEVFDINDEARAAIEDRALSTGLLPAGVYTLTFSLENCSSAGSDDIVWDIRNTTRVELISPRDGESTGEFPFFEFFQEGPRARLTVAEMSDGQTKEDAITRDPAMLVADLTNERSFLYQGGRPLEKGKTYVWRVETFTRIAGGDEVALSSPVYGFTVSETPGTTGDGSEFDYILARLEAIYGAQYPGIFHAIREGSYKLTGDYTLDGGSISEADLQALFDTLQESVDSSELTLEEGGR
jgi:hypothetical protein